MRAKLVRKSAETQGRTLSGSELYDYLPATIKTPNALLRFNTATVLASLVTWRAEHSADL